MDALFNVFEGNDQNIFSRFYRINVFNLYNIEQVETWVAGVRGISLAQPLLRKTQMENRSCLKRQTRPQALRKRFRLKIKIAWSWEKTLCQS